jgi:hypothetical protein
MIFDGTSVFGIKISGNRKHFIQISLILKGEAGVNYQVR